MNKKKLIYAFGFVCIILLGIIAYEGKFLFKNHFDIQDYCQKKAVAIVGKDFAKTVKPTKEELAQFPDMTEISLGFREQLKCEHDPKTMQKAWE